MRLFCTVHPLEVGQKKQGLATVPAVGYLEGFELGTATSAE